MRAWLLCTCVCAVLLTSTTASAQQLHAFVDDDGVVHISDRQNDPRQAPYAIGDFERMALSQETTPHEGVAVRAFLLRRHANDGSPAFGGVKPQHHAKFDDLILQASKKYGVPFALVKSVVAVESAFDPKATSRVGAQGLMQLMPQTARELGVKDAYDPAANIDGGTRYLAGLLRMFQRNDLAVAAYNAGPGRVRRLGRIPNIRETQRYVKKVLRLRAHYAQSR